MISIVIPLYNKESSILDTINSVLNQSFTDFEIIIVDDGSTDNSADVIHSITDTRIQYIFQKNAGPSAARNRGVKEAKFDWVFFLDADDRLEEGALLMFSDMRQRNPNINIFCANFYLESADSKELLYQNIQDGIVPNNFKAWFFYEMILCQGSAMYKRDLLLNHPFNENLRRYEDAGMQFELMRNEKIYRTSRPSFSYIQDTSDASHGRPDIHEDFVSCLKPQGKSFWEQMVLFQFYQEGTSIYPEQIRSIYPNTPFSLKFRILRQLATKLRLLKHIP